MEGKESNVLSGREQKNTAFNGSTGQIRTDATSGGLVRSAHNIPTDTQGVPSDAAKVQINHQLFLKICSASLAECIWEREKSVPLQ